MDSLTDLDDITSSADVLNNLKGMLEGIADSLGLSEAKQVRTLLTKPFSNMTHRKKNKKFKTTSLKTQCTRPSCTTRGLCTNY